jgi:biopolymer transport protein ExbB/TolQ
MGIEEILFEIADALRYPVLLATIVCLALSLFEAGALVGEIYQRRGRALHSLERARSALTTGDRGAASRALQSAAFNDAMSGTLADVVELRGLPDAPERVAKRLAEFDYRSMMRLERTRILVRLGPALGLMGTLIPLAPALAGLADGNVAELTENLRVAFSVTVTGLLAGAIAFAVSLVRDRLYGQDYSDLEYVAATLARVDS